MPWELSVLSSFKIGRVYGIIAVRACHSGEGEAQKERQNCTKDFL